MSAATLTLTNAPRAKALALRSEQGVIVPSWVRDLASFRLWAKSDEFPNRGWIAYLAGNLSVDLSMERLKHNELKSEFCTTLRTLTKQMDIGRFFGDGMSLTSIDADLCTEPDGMFVRFDSLARRAAKLEDKDDCLELIGTPDMVLEVVSPSSRKRDLEILRNLYWRAGISEYWLVNPLDPDSLAFDILRRGSRSYAAVRRTEDGWVKSAVFAKQFQLKRDVDRGGCSTFALNVR